MFLKCCFRRTWLVCKEPLTLNTKQTQSPPHMHRPKTYHMTPTHSHTNTPVSILLSNTCSSPVTHSESVILTVQSNSSLFSRLTVWFIAFCCSSLNSDLCCERRRDRSIITFYGFIPPQQWRCHPETAPLCFSAYFMPTDIITVRRMADLRWSKCDSDLVFLQGKENIKVVSLY